MAQRRRLISLAATLLAVNATSAAAEEELFFASLPVVASVSRLQQPLAEAPGSMTVIDRGLIRQSGARSVSELMRLVPGFLVTPANQASPRVTYHGLSDEGYSPRVQVLIDGVSQYSPLFHGGVNWNLLPVALEDIERIEVLRGSNSTAYGANAFMGVINIISQDPSLTKGWMLKANHGDRGVRDYTLRWGGKIGEADVRLTVQQNGDDGLRHMYAGGRWFDPHDNRNAKVFDLRGTLPLSNDDELQFSLSQAYDISQTGRPKDISDPFRDASKSSSSLSLGWRRSLGEGEELRLRFSHVEDWASDQYFVLFGGKNFLISDSGSGSRSELELQHNFSPSSTTRAVWGASIKNEQVQSSWQFFTKDTHSRFSTRLFGNLEWRPVTSLLFNAGANLENSTSKGGTSFDPRLGASWHLTPEQTLRFVISRNHRTPGLFESQGDSRYSPVNLPAFYDRIFMAYQGRIKPERLDSAEIGYLWDLKEYRASLDFRAFHERMADKLQYTSLKLSAANRDIFQYKTSGFPFGAADSYFNAETVRSRGFEYQFKWQPFEGTRILYNHSYIRIDTRVAPSFDYIYPAQDIATMTNFTQHSAPRHAGYLMWMQRLPYNLESSISYYKSGYMRWTRNTYIDPIERVDWRLAWPFRFGANRGELAYTVQAANRTNAEFSNNRLFGQRNWVSLQLDF